MATPVTMPMLGLTMEEGTVAEWLKKEGDTVARDEPLLMVEMDKGTMEVPSPAAGIVRRIVVQPGTTVPVKTVIAEIGDPDEVLTVSPTGSSSPVANTSPSGTSSPANPLGQGGSSSLGASSSQADSSVAGASSSPGNPLGQGNPSSLGVSSTPGNSSVPGGGASSAGTSSAGAPLAGGPGDLPPAAASGARNAETSLASGGASSMSGSASPPGPSGPGGSLQPDDSSLPDRSSASAGASSVATPSAGAALAGGPGDLPAQGASGAQLAEAAAAGAAGPLTSRTPGGAPGDGTRLFASPRARLQARGLSVDLATIRGTGPHGRIVEADVLAAGVAGVADMRVAVTPLARRLAQEQGVDLDAVQGTGPGGRITQDDVVAAASRLSAGAATSAVGAQSASAGGAMAESEPSLGGAATSAIEAQSASGGGATAESQPSLAGDRAPVGGQGGQGGQGDLEAQEGQVRPLSRLRRLTAERMAASAQATARVTLFLDADFSEAARFREQLQPEFARLGMPKLPWDALIARAAALALVEHPALLAQWVEGQGLRSPETVDVGVAVALDPEGLVVPVLRQASTRSLRELAADLLVLAEKARAGRLSPADMQGGTFTITNLGAYRIDGFTPIVNPPETAILGVGRIAPRAVVIDGKVEPRTMCTLSLSFDHRVVDGAQAAAFVARLAELVERPYALLGI